MLFVDHQTLFCFVCHSEVGTVLAFVFFDAADRELCIVLLLKLLGNKCRRRSCFATCLFVMSLLLSVLLSHPILIFVAIDNVSANMHVQPNDY